LSISSKTYYHAQYWLTLSLPHLTKISVAGYLVIENPSSKLIKDFCIVIIGESQCVVPSSLFIRKKLQAAYKS